MENYQIKEQLQDILVYLGDLKDQLKIKNQNKFTFRSEDINELATALAKAQGEYTIAGLNRQNPYFKSKYADLASVVNAARPALTKYGLSVVQNILAHD